MVSRMIHYVVFVLRLRKLFCISYETINKLRGCGYSFFPLSEGEVPIPNGRTCQNRWQAPLVNWVKLNIDGSCWSNLNLASAVEVVRDQHGKWVIGYGRNIDSCIAVVTELWTIFDGLQLLWSKGANHVLLENDSKVVVHACTSEDDSYGNYALTSCIKEIQHRNWTVHVTHIYRESNIATHALTILTRS
ncbi:hypothetical protein Godav_002891 [Gossypium davidsonii]|uniref:RNase H type-1 domain-containing protein n=2 Tax=Gossypium TaxID=3633 RepID=A0A7J8SXJ4_GOSDV|nr:hypothetical protein [Gossypium davidsonii]MBA0666549.1 hypothetical protein [Gossypium klotzschianum]